MSAVVLQFRPRPAKPAPRASRPALPSSVPQYYCLACDGDTFELMHGGLVYCASCRASMRNLFVNHQGEP